MAKLSLDTLTIDGNMDIQNIAKIAANTDYIDALIIRFDLNQADPADKVSAITNLLSDSGTRVTVSSIGFHIKGEMEQISRDLIDAVEDMKDFVSENAYANALEEATFGVLMEDLSPAWTRELQNGAGTNFQTNWRLDPGITDEDIERLDLHLAPEVQLYDNLVFVRGCIGMDKDMHVTNKNEFTTSVSDHEIIRETFSKLGVA